MQPTMQSENQHQYTPIASVTAEQVQELNPTPSLRHPKVHKTFGILFVLIGSLMFLFDLVGFFGGDDRFLSGVGVWMGLLYTITGALCWSASNKDGTGLLCAGLVFDIIVSCMGATGITFASMEISIRSLPFTFVMKDGHFRLEEYDNDNTGSYVVRYKGVFDLLAIISISILAIIHSGFACHDCCSCCNSPENNIQMQVQPIQQYPQVIQQPIIYNQQQQFAGYPQGQQTVIYPLQQNVMYVQQAYPQQSVYLQQNLQQQQPDLQGGYFPYQPPTNPSFTNTAGSMENPPPYEANTSTSQSYPMKA